MAAYDSKVVTGERLSQTLGKIKDEFIHKVGWGVCTTAAATAAKTVSIGSKNTVSLTNGTVIAVKFTDAVPSNATLNVNNLGAKDIRFRGTNITANVISAGQVVFFCYNGNQWDVIDTNSWREVKVGDTTAIAPTSNAALKFVGAGSVTVTYENNAVKINGSPTDISGKMNKGVTLNTSTQTVTDSTITDLHFSDQSNVKARFNTEASPGESLIELTAKTANANLEGTGRADVVNWSGSALPQFKSAVKISSSDNETPNTFVVPAATKSAYGVIKVGDGILVDTDLQAANNNYGTISVTNENLGQGYGTTSTAAATADKVVTMSNYSLVVGGIVTVKFTNAVNAGQNLNINSKGAKPIYYKGAAITANIIKAGDIATFIYTTTPVSGGCYELISIDRWQSDISTLTTDVENMSGDIGDINDTIGSIQDDITDLENDKQNNLIYYSESAQTATLSPQNLVVSASSTAFNGAVDFTGSASFDNSVAFEDAVTVGSTIDLGDSATADTKAITDNSTNVATTAFVQALIADKQTGAAMFQGTVGTNTGDVLTPDSGSTPFSSLTDYKKGQYWVVATAGTYAGNSCEVGDFIFCVVNKGSGSYSANHFTVVQNNMETITETEINTVWSTVFG